MLRQLDEHYYGSGTGNALRRHCHDTIVRLVTEGAGYYSETLASSTDSDWKDSLRQEIQETEEYLRALRYLLEESY